MRLQKEVSDRIAMLRPLLIIGVVFVHVGGISYIPSKLDPGMFTFFAAFFKNALFRGTVPAMSLISGYLLFSAGLDRIPSKLYKKKFATLAIPFVVFNLYACAFMAAVNSAFGLAFPTLARLPSEPIHMFSAVFGIDGIPLNGPLHFVRDMMVAVAFAPIFGVVLRRCPWLGLAALVLFFGTNMDGTLILRASSLILFYIGGAAATYRWNVAALDKYAKPCLAILIVACLAIIGLRVDDNTIFVIAAPFLIWPAASLLQNTRIESWAIGFCKYSFFIFVAHMPIIDSLWWGVSHHARWIPYPVFWFAAPALTVYVLKVVYDAAMNFAPRSFNFIIGARALKPAFVDRRHAPRPASALVYSDEARLAMSRS